MRHGSLLAGALLGASLASAPAMAAPERDLAACSEAFSSAPERIKAGKLLTARSQLALCAAEPCPATMRPLCLQDLRHLDEQIPTVVFVARGSRGEDLLDVKVTEGTTTIAERLDGRAIAVDPGPHAFRFERAGSAAVVTEVVLHEGERARDIAATIPTYPAVFSSPVPPPLERPRPIPWTAYLAGGVTLAAAASFTTFGVWGVTERSNLASCKGSCSASAVNDVSTHFTIADVSLVTGVVALGLTAILYLTRPEAAASASLQHTLWVGTF